MNTSENSPVNTCEQFRNFLVECGEHDTLQNPDQANHLESCPECQQVFKAWKELPGLLEQLPEHEPDSKAVASVKAAVSPDQGRNRARRRRYLAPSLASAAVLLAAIGLSRELLMHESPKIPMELNRPQSVQRQQISGGKVGDDPGTVVFEEELFNDEFALREKKGNAGQARESETVELQSASRNRMDKAQSEFAENRPAPAAQEPETPRASGPGDAEQLRRKDGQLEAPGHQPSKLEGADDALSKEIVDKRANVTDSLDSLVVTGERNEVGSFKADRDGLLEDAEAKHAKMAAFNFLSFYEQTDSISTQPATGYWANTYVPGDPEIRLLNARLAQWDRSWLENNAALERSVSPVQQPFDAPEDNALSLSLMADAQAIAVSGAQKEPTRLRLQVGIQGIEHRRGQRPAMNLGVVIDLPGDASDEVRIAARALLDGLLQSRQAGDRFSLVFTGPPGQSLVVEADDFRFGSLQLANQRIAGEAPVVATGEDVYPDGLDVLAALQLASAHVRQNEDPSRPLGSSSTWLIGAQSLKDLEDLTRLAHAQARDGVTLSVFPLGNRLSGQQVEQLVLAGLGSRRFLEAPNQARKLVEEELLSASRAVARAVRLSVRLAPGVQLIDVIGSQRLDTVQAQRVRDIENSMDQRLASNLGIQADRGNDEDGIQIMIPSIYSGDSVTVLLDIMTDRPGAVADVNLRYKDLVYLRNGNLSAQLELPAANRVSGPDERGPAELAVLKNLLAWHFSEAVKQAADALGQQQVGQAVAILNNMAATIEQARLDVPGWSNDPDLLRDQQILDRYITALEKPQANSHQPFLADSLRFAAWAKTHRTPEEWK